MTTPGAVLIGHQTPSALGGSEQSMLQHSAMLRERGWTVDLVHAEAPGTAVDHAFDASFSLPELFSPNLSGSTRAVTALRAIARERDYSLAHMHLWSLRTLRATAKVMPVVATCHLPFCPNGARYHYAKERSCDRKSGAVCLTRGYYADGCGHTADEQPFGVHALAKAAVSVKLTVRALNDCAGVVAPSRWQADRLAAEGVDRNRIAVIAPGIGDPQRAPSPPSDQRAAILVVARLVVFKGVQHVLRASAQLQAPHEVHIVGTGPMREPLEREAQTLGIADRVRFLGGLSGAPLEEAFGRSSVVAVPSLIPETFGMVGVEAMLRGRPVVAYAQAGMTDWLDAGSPAIGVSPGDVHGLASALDAVITDPARAETLRAAGPDWAARFKAQATATDVERLYSLVTR